MAVAQCSKIGQIVEKKAGKLSQLPSLDILFSLNHNIHKSSCGFCFWASDPFHYFSNFRALCNSHCQLMVHSCFTCRAERFPPSYISLDESKVTNLQLCVTKKSLNCPSRNRNIYCYSLVSFKSTSIYYHQL